MDRRWVLVAATLALVACEGDDPGDAFTNSPAPTSAPPVISEAPSPTVSPTPPALPSEPPPTAGPVSETCAQGWVTPEEGTPEFSDPIGIIRRQSPFDGDYEVVDMRMFVGAESPPSDKNYIVDIRRWYIKLYAVDDITYQGRFLVEERRFGRGVAAVAPYDTEGFASPDWVGFQWDASDTTWRRYPGLPGRWRGIPYDFVQGGEGLTIPGLPAEVVGCLDGT
jgi:hypothetical protein